MPKSKGGSQDSQNINTKKSQVRGDDRRHSDSDLPRSKSNRARSNNNSNGSFRNNERMQPRIRSLICAVEQKTLPRGSRYRQGYREDTRVEQDVRNNYRDQPAFLEPSLASNPLQDPLQFPQFARIQRSCNLLMALNESESVNTSENLHTSTQDLQMFSPSTRTSYGAFHQAHDAAGVNTSWNDYLKEGSSNIADEGGNEVIPIKIVRDRQIGPVAKVNFPKESVNCLYPNEPNITCQKIVDKTAQVGVHENFTITTTNENLQTLPANLTDKRSFGNKHNNEQFTGNNSYLDGTANTSTYLDNFHVDSLPFDPFFDINAVNAAPQSHVNFNCSLAPEQSNYSKPPDNVFASNSPKPSGQNKPQTEVNMVQNFYGTSPLQYNKLLFDIAHARLENSRKEREVWNMHFEVLCTQKEVAQKTLMLREKELEILNKQDARNKLLLRNIK